MHTQSSHVMLYLQFKLNVSFLSGFWVDLESREAAQEQHESFLLAAWSLPVTLEAPSNKREELNNYENVVH